MRLEKKNILIKSILTIVNYWNTRQFRKKNTKQSQRKNNAYLSLCVTKQSSSLCIIRKTRETFCILSKLLFKSRLNMNILWQREYNIPDK